MKREKIFLLSELAGLIGESMILRFASMYLFNHCTVLWASTMCSCHGRGWVHCWARIWLLRQLRSSSLCIAPHLATYEWSRVCFVTDLVPVVWQVSTPKPVAYNLWVHNAVSAVFPYPWVYTQKTRRKPTKKNYAKKYSTMIVISHWVEIPRSWVIWSVNKLGRGGSIFIFWKLTFCLLEAEGWEMSSQRTVYGNMPAQPQHRAQRLWFLATDLYWPWPAAAYQRPLVLSLICLLSAASVELFVLSSGQPLGRGSGEGARNRGGPWPSPKLPCTCILEAEQMLFLALGSVIFKGSNSFVISIYLLSY